MRVSLRPPSFADVERIAACMQDPETVRWLSSIPVPYSRQDAVDFVGRAAQTHDRCVLVDGAFAGMIRTGADLGYWIAPEFRGKGVATRAAQASMMQHFQQADDTARAWYYTGNHGSRRVLEALGFEDVGEIMMEWQGEEKLPARMMELSRRAFAKALEIRTPRCVITALRDEDMPEVDRVVAWPDAMRTLFHFGPGQDLAEVDTLIRPSTDVLQRPMRMAIRHDGRFIGTIGVEDGVTPLIYYFLAPEAAGQGFASEVLPAFCDNVQEWFGLTELSAAAFSGHHSARRVLEKAGFKIEFEGSSPSANAADPVAGWYIRRA